MNDINHNHERLLAAMGNDPESWEYRGEEIKSHGDNCACGHNIIYVYPMYHKVTGASIKIGSVCIETAPFMPNSMVEAYKAFLEKKKAERKAQAETLKKAEVAVRAEVLQGLVDQAYSVIEHSGDYMAWKTRVGMYKASYYMIKNAIAKAVKTAHKPYKTSSGLLKAIDKEILNLTNVLEKKEEFSKVS